jgi:hypothetical protein
MLPPLKTYAAWPVWSDSTTKEVRFQPMTKRQAVQLWHDARRFERQTREPGKQDGAIGRNGLAILQALLFDFLNYRCGALYPSWAAIAEAANISATLSPCVRIAGPCKFRRLRNIPTFLANHDRLLIVLSGPNARSSVQPAPLPVG